MRTLVSTLLITILLALSNTLPKIGVKHSGGNSTIYAGRPL